MENVEEGPHISLIETMLSIFFIANQWRTSGMRAWNLMSLTPAISSVDLKYLSAESPPRFLKLYTRYLLHESRFVIRQETRESRKQRGEGNTHLVTSPKARPSFLK